MLQNFLHSIKNFLGNYDPSNYLAVENFVEGAVVGSYLATKHGKNPVQKGIIIGGVALIGATVKRIAYKKKQKP